VIPGKADDPVRPKGIHGKAVLSFSGCFRSGLLLTPDLKTEALLLSNGNRTSADQLIEPGGLAVFFVLVQKCELLDNAIERYAGNGFGVKSELGPSWAVWASSFCQVTKGSDIYKNLWRKRNWENEIHPIQL
jgi:hypothetical protein